jgi:hypothetical protein
MPAPIDTAEPQEAEPELVSFCNQLEDPQEATGTSCEVFIPTEPQNIQAWLWFAMYLLQLWSEGYKPDTRTAVFVEKYKALDVPDKYRLSERLSVQVETGQSRVPVIYNAQNFPTKEWLQDFDEEIGKLKGIKSV